MSFPKAFIEELKQRNKIEDIISKYIDLKRAGSISKGLCPFHSERTPSFTVFANDSFHCFGCGAGGDVITFIMQAENLDYLEAIQFLADRAGITVPKDNFENPVKKSILSRERNFLINAAAARIFHNNLLSNEAKEAQEYLKNRGLAMSTIKRFGVGFALNDFSQLSNELKKLGFTYEEMKEAFICGLSKNGNYYDYFRNRIMFPIIDTSGKVVAFGGRVMDNSQPKYLNTSDTPVFKKSKTLYAFNFAKNIATGSHDENGIGSYAKSGELILCEGYMDVISLHQAGFYNAIATLGTAITSEHARMMSRVAKTVYISYDSDGAGVAAADKALNMLYDVGVDAKVIKISNGAKDPDEFIKKFGAVAFSKLLSGSSGQTDYRINGILQKYNLDDPDEKLKAISEVCKALVNVYPEYKREVYVIRLSELTNVSKETLLSEIKRKSYIKKKQEEKKIFIDTQNSMHRYSDRVNSEAASNPKACQVEERILGILILHSEYFSKISKDYKNNFVTEFNKNLFSILFDLFDEDKFDLAYLNEIYSPSEIGRITEISEKRKILTVNSFELLKIQFEELQNIKSKSINQNNDEFFKDFESLRNKKINKDT